ncbi:Flagellin B [Stylophora pistillata]|uniref:Flagellin B n=1 Tax=Stylophora pistillata TaxID=50429 RepID=A0A2B4RVL2_STYPI|nr:Flagellin B [Stylophora pistillata]
MSRLCEARSITLHAQKGDRLQDVDANITDQRSDVKASVGEEEKLQIFAPTQKVDEEINIGGNLGTEMGFGASRYVAVADTNVTSKRGSQQALAVLNGAIEAVNGQLTDLCVLENHMSPVINCRRGS